MILLVQVILSESCLVFSCSFETFIGGCELRVFLVYHLDSAPSQNKNIVSPYYFSGTNLKKLLEKAVHQQRRQAKPLLYPSMERKKRKRKKKREREMERQRDGDKEK